MKKNFLFAVFFISLLVMSSLSCSKSSDSNTGGYGSGGGGGGGAIAPTPVSILPMSYSPSSLTVKVGTVVKWTNTDNTAHTVTSNDAVTFNSGTINYPGTYSYTTVTTGTFPYHCTIHGVTMAGTLIVTP
ncbi:MAG TPA: cupredoxin domain-containing protein [Ferruginibacter sp.]|nr:cupredoxin domain-containing protein [Ferruginibacter sp.]